MYYPVGSNSIYPQTISTTGNGRVNTRISTTGDNLIPLITTQSNNSSYASGIGLDSNYYYNSGVYEALAGDDSQTSNINQYSTDVLDADDTVTDPDLGYNPTPGLGDNPQAIITTDGRMHFGINDVMTIGLSGLGQGFMFNAKNKEQIQLKAEAKRNVRIEQSKLLGLDTKDYETAVDNRNSAKGIKEKAGSSWGNSEAKSKAKVNADKALTEKKTAAKALDKQIDKFQVDQNKLKTNNTPVVKPENYNITGQVTGNKLSIGMDEITLSDADAKYLTSEKPWYKTQKAWENSKQDIVDKAITKYNSDHAAHVKFGDTDLTLTAKEAKKWDNASAKEKTKIAKDAAKRQAKSTKGYTKPAFKTTFKSAFKSNLIAAAAGNVVNTGITGYNEYKETGELGKATVKSLATGTVNTVITSAATAVGTALFPGIGTVAGFLIGGAIGGVASWGATQVSNTIFNQIPGWSDTEIAQENAQKAAKKAGTEGNDSTNAQVISSDELEAQLATMSEAEQEEFILQVQQAVQAGQIVIQ